MSQVCACLAIWRKYGVWLPVAARQSLRACSHTCSHRNNAMTSSCPFIDHPSIGITVNVRKALEFSGLGDSCNRCLGCWMLPWKFTAISPVKRVTYHIASLFKGVKQGVKLFRDCRISGYECFLSQDTPKISLNLEFSVMCPEACQCAHGKPCSPSLTNGLTMLAYIVMYSELLLLASSVCAWADPFNTVLNRIPIISYEVIVCIPCISSRVKSLLNIHWFSEYAPGADHLFEFLARVRIHYALSEVTLSRQTHPKRKLDIPNGIS